MQYMHTVLMLAQLRWTGHVLRMSDSKQSFLRESALKVSRRNLQRHLTKGLSEGIDLPIESWEQTAQELSKWRCLVNKGAAHYEEKKNVKLKESAENAKPRPMFYHQIL